MTNQELQNKVFELETLTTKLQGQIDALKNNATIPFDIGEAMKARILADAGVALTSSKVASSEDKSVNEGGIATYNVLNSPDGFLQITLLGNIYYLPYFT